MVKKVLRAFAWPSDETSKTLLPIEVEELARCTQQLSELGELSDGKYIGACEAIYWYRLKQGD